MKLSTLIKKQANRNLSIVPDPDTLKAICSLPIMQQEIRRFRFNHIVDNKSIETVGKEFVEKKIKEGFLKALNDEDVVNMDSTVTSDETIFTIELTALV